jgi:hypothetical protein
LVDENPSDPANPFLNHGFIATPETEPKSNSLPLVSQANDFSNSPRWSQDLEELGKGFGKWARQLH